MSPNGVHGTLADEVVRVDAELAVRMSPSANSTGSRRRREALLRLARRSAAESDPLQVMGALLGEAEHLHGASAGSVGKWDEERQVLVEPTRPHGQGLANMAERARLIGAQLTIMSRAGSGTEVRVELPLGEGPPRE